MKKSNPVSFSPVTLSFPHASVQLTQTLSMAGRKEGGEGIPCLKLYVQAIDVYGFQRELSVAHVWQYDPQTELSRYFWQFHVYTHPGVREICEVTESQAKRFISRFLSLAQNYPTLLFTGENSPCNAGFVHLCERLFRGATLEESLP